MGQVAAIKDPTREVEMRALPGSRSAWLQVGARSNEAPCAGPHAHPFGAFSGSTHLLAVAQKMRRQAD